MLNSITNFPSLTTAFIQVKENHGCAGVDGVTIEEFETDLPKNLSEISNEIKHKQYSPLPLIKIIVDKGKGNNEGRALCVPTVRDRIVQTAVLHIIEPILEKEFEDCSFAYRKGRSVKQAVYKIKSCYNDGYRWVVDADIDAFFDSVDHDLMIEKVKRFVEATEVVKLIEMWIKAEVWDGDNLIVINKGIPQGSPLSPILANLFLDELDEEMLKKKLRYVRFADDFLVLCKSPDMAKDALEFTNEMLEKLLLKLDEADIVSFDEGFRYLGVMFIRSLIMTPFDKPKRERKVLYYPPPMNLSAYLLKKKKGW
ncbi:RNA-directed DNA polymerase [candidate division WS5 bacterium]|uniref:RNA-directed DNA polymerase n=1 Tax=candidate division WS5 bacterium TaxID=2093353 RepID=A0A419DDZ8_9BACT|nr:MAG: RNA-directed DNA polymerase [candidate division WS5 bacterium]